MTSSPPGIIIATLPRGDGCVRFGAAGTEQVPDHLTVLLVVLPLLPPVRRHESVGVDGIEPERSRDARCPAAGEHGVVRVCADRISEGDRVLHVPNANHGSGRKEGYGG